MLSPTGAYQRSVACLPGLKGRVGVLYLAAPSPAWLAVRLKTCSLVISSFHILRCLTAVGDKGGDPDGDGHWECQRFGDVNGPDECLNRLNGIRAAVCRVPHWVAQLTGVRRVDVSVVYCIRVCVLVAPV